MACNRVDSGSNPKIWLQRICLFQPKEPKRKINRKCDQPVTTCSVERLIHVNSVEASSPSNGLMWKFGKGRSSGLHEGRLGLHCHGDLESFGILNEKICTDCTNQAVFAID
ncbi:hypothetical protein TNCV_4369831 [Trichonephila clavipes]|nr:hypothetical protein TNCV_4369831 [Trichonephila clavipes]